MKIDKLVNILKSIKSDKTLLDSLIRQLPDISLGGGHLEFIEIQGDTVILHGKSENNMNLIITFGK